MKRLLPIAAVMMAVLLNVVGAVTLKEISGVDNPSVFLVTLVIGFVIVLNGARFVVWGVAHRHYPISKSYPLSTLFFPIILAVSVFYGSELTWQHLLGTALIVIGILKISFQKDIST